MRFLLIDVKIVIILLVSGDERITLRCILLKVVAKGQSAGPRPFLEML